MADQGAEGLLSPFLRRQRFAAVAGYLEGNVLDFGCGAGGLAALVDPRRYFGVEPDDFSRERAHSRSPRHRFSPQLPDNGERFDTIVALAVIEHVADPAALIRVLAGFLVEGESARLVLTTPHPSLDWVHHAGAAIGLFSRHASEEHETLLDRKRLEQVGAGAGLTLARYSRFLLGANQLAAFRRDVASK